MFQPASKYFVAVQQPINADGSSNFKYNGKAVIPVKFELSVGPGPLTFQSIGTTPTNPNDDYSCLSFRPASPMTFNELLELRATYQFAPTGGNCHGGSLRWTVRLDDGDGVPNNDGIHIYYGAERAFTECITPNDAETNQSGRNLLDYTDDRFDTSQFTAWGTFYDTLAHARQQVGHLPVKAATLVLDSGWQQGPYPLGDQFLVQGSPTLVTVNGNVYDPTSTPPTRICTLPPAKIQVSKLSSGAYGLVNEPESVQPRDNNEYFRIVDCKYMYNLSTSSLSGFGSYKVEVLINGTVPAEGAAYFELR